MNMWISPEQIKSHVSKNILTISFWLFLLLYFRAVIKDQIIHKGDSWLAGDWLINYQSGFIRRGLTGEIILRLSQQFSFPILDSLVLLKTGLYVVIVFGLILLTYNKKISIFEFLLFLAPWALMFEVIDFRGSGRKELVLIAVFIWFILLDRSIKIMRHPHADYWRIVYLTIAFPIMILIHEGLFFFFPLFFIYLLFNSEELSINKKSQYFLPIAVAILSIGCIYYFRFSDPESVRHICRSIVKMKVDQEICAGGIDALKYSYPNFDKVGLASFYLIPFLLATLGTLVYAYHVNKNANKNKIIASYFLGFLFIIPLFWVSVDWGRWIHIFVFLFFLQTYASREKIEDTLHNGFNRKQYLLNSVGLVFYTFAWKLKPFIGDDRSLIRITFNLLDWMKALIK